MNELQQFKVCCSLSLQAVYPGANGPQPIIVSWTDFSSSVSAADCPSGSLSPAQERTDFNNSTSAVMCPFRPFALCAGTRRLGMTEVFPIMSRCVVSAASSSFYQQACRALPVISLALIPVSIPHVLRGKHPSGSSISPAPLERRQRWIPARAS